jgi:hypothetical protein
MSARIWSRSRQKSTAVDTRAPLTRNQDSGLGPSWAGAGTPGAGAPVARWPATGTRVAGAPRCSAISAGSTMRAERIPMRLSFQRPGSAVTMPISRDPVKTAAPESPSHPLWPPGSSPGGRDSTVSARPPVDSADDGASRP